MGHLFSSGNLGEHLENKLSKIRNAVAGWDEERLLTLPEADIIQSLTTDFLVEPLALDRGAITTHSVEDGFITAGQFGRSVNIPQTVATSAVPYTGTRELPTSMRRGRSGRRSGMSVRRRKSM
jgi:hypothetical protein